MGAIVFLSLESNSIGVGGANAIGAALKTNMSLETVNLGDNDIGGSTGHEPAARVLETTSILTSLGMRMNEIGDEGVRAIAQALRGNHTLASLGEVMFAVFSVS